MFTENSLNHTWIIAITGSSGTIYGRRLLQSLIENIPDIKIELIISEAALRVMREEEAFRTSIGRVRIEDLINCSTDAVTIHSNRNIGASIASGSYPVRGMLIVPCSMKTLAAVSCGYCDNLIQRAADVTLKERRQLIIVPRETPLSSIHLENMLKLSRISGVQIVPAMPGFYHQPKSIMDLVDLMVMRIIDQMGLKIELTERWGLSPAEVANKKIINDTNI